MLSLKSTFTQKIYNPSYVSACRVCLLSNYSETFLKEFDEMVTRMVNGSKTPLILSWNLTIMKKNIDDSGEVFFSFSEQHAGELGYKIFKYLFTSVIGVLKNG